MPFAALPADKQRRLVAQYRALLMDLRTHDEIMVEMDLSPGDLAQVRARFMQQEVASIEGLSVEEHYSELRARQSKCVKDLEELARKTKDPRSAVAATKAASEIIFRLFNEGQKLGIIPQEVKRVEVVGKFLIGSMSTKDVLDEVRKLASGITDMRVRSGDEHILDVPAEEPEPVRRTKVLAAASTGPACPPPPKMTDEDEDEE